MEELEYWLLGTWNVDTLTPFQLNIYYFTCATPFPYPISGLHVKSTNCYFRPEVVFYCTLSKQIFWGASLLFLSILFKRWIFLISGETNQCVSVVVSIKRNIIIEPFCHADQTGKISIKIPVSVKNRLQLDISPPRLDF